MVGYARLLKIHAFIDLYYCIINVATSVEPFPFGGNFYLVPTGFLRHVNDRHLWTFFFGAYYHSILAEMSITPVDFYYRYLNICRHQTMTDRHLYSFIALLFTLSVIHSFPAYLALGNFGPSFETPFEANVTMKLHEIDRFADLETIFAYNPTSGFMEYFNLVILQLNFTIGFLVISWSYLKIRKKLKDHSTANPSSNIHHIESQINSIMLLQLLLPVLGISLSIIITGTTGVMQFSFPEMGAINRIVTKWISALKPIITVTIVSAYRKKFFESLFSLGKAVTLNSSIEHMTSVEIVRE
ncbi:unnamed protein product [Bursaphelenchus xylophilus]|uniref:(pine wood nematode) hypothetical protein n=1 Tax=Bursaphelenchus xylophilus TaxID=6326 RepID=A0A1I7RMG6_BURXY|nr:unnamed protein product [Bursaphelenchus xylophilus]CAG9118471.1 unnamed protein product [Bursaphelenchus xylophilus]